MTRLRLFGRHTACLRFHWYWYAISSAVCRGLYRAPLRRVRALWRTTAFRRVRLVCLPHPAIHRIRRPVRGRNLFNGLTSYYSLDRLSFLPRGDTVLLLQFGKHTRFRQQRVQRTLRRPNVAAVFGTDMPKVTSATASSISWPRSRINAFNAFNGESAPACLPH